MADKSNLQRVVKTLLEHGKSEKIDVVNLKKRLGISKSEIFRLLRELKYRKAIDYVEYKSGKNNKLSNMVISDIYEDVLIDLQDKSKIRSLIIHIGRHKVPYVILFITIISTFGITAYFHYKDYPADDPRSSDFFSLTFVPLSRKDIFIESGNPNNFNFRYHLIHEGNKCITEGRLFYYLIGQNNNTCGENISFFNPSKGLHILCKTQEIDLGSDIAVNEMCHPYISYACKERKTYETNFYDLIRAFDELMAEKINLNSCFLKETIKLCINDDAHCSEDINFEIEYVKK